MSSAPLFPTPHRCHRARSWVLLAVLQLLAAGAFAGCEDEKEPFAEEGNSGDDGEHADEHDEPSDDEAEPSDAPSSDAKDAGASDDPPADDEPAGDKPAGDEPARDKPAGDERAGDKPAGDTPAEPKPAEEKPAEPAKKPIYAYIHSVTDDATYVTLTNAIDFKSDSPELALSKAREFEGSILAVSGYILEQPEGSAVKQWKVSDDLKWTQGPTADFSQYPLPEGANLFFNFQAGERAMYMPFEINKRIVWDPIDMKLVKVIETSKLPLQLDGLMALPAGNRSNIHYENGVKAPFFYLDEDYLEFAPKSTLAAYDKNTHEETALIDLPCPGLAVATQDEEGHTYYSTWDFSPLQALYGKGPKPCVARLKPDDKLDEAFTTDMTDLTGGRYVANFYYVRDGWGVMDVLHHETLELDFEAATIPTEAVAEVWDRSHWKIWFVDLENKTARPLEELGADINLSFWHITRIDGRVFMRLGTDEETTKIYELDKTGVPTLWDEIDDGEAEWQRIR